MNDINTLFTNIVYTIDPLTGGIIGVSVVTLLSAITIFYKFKKNKKIKLAKEKEKEKNISSETIQNIEKNLVEPIHTVSPHSHKVLNQINTLQPSENLSSSNNKDSLMYVSEKMNDINLNSKELVSQLTDSSLIPKEKSIKTDTIPSLSSLLKSSALIEDNEHIKVEENKTIKVVEELPEIPLLSIEDIVSNSHIEVQEKEENKESSNLIFEEQSALSFEHTSDTSSDLNKVVIEDLDFFMYNVAITANEEDKKIVEEEKRYQQQLTNEFGPLNDVSKLISTDSSVENHEIKSSPNFEVTELAELGTMIRKESEGLDVYPINKTDESLIKSNKPQSIWINWMLIRHGQSTAKTSVFEIQNKWGTKQAVIELENLLNNEISVINQDYSYSWSVISVVPLED